LKDKSKKRLNSIYNLEYNPFTHEVAMHRICRYLPDTDDWVYQGELSEWSMDFGLTEDKHAALRLKNLLKDLSEENPETKAYRFVPALDHLKAAR
jgi:hypothetical protein